MNETEKKPAAPPLAQPMETVDPIATVIEDPRSHPAFAEAYANVCGQTIIGLDTILAAGDDVDQAIVNNEYQALTQRIASVYGREELWSATDPLVFEFAETIADGLASVLDGTDVGLSYLAGDITLFRSLCQDWSSPT